MGTKVYVGNLAKDATENELEKAFSSYGPLKSVWVARNPAGFAFVEFDDSRDAEDAVHGLDGTNICGGRVRVEVSTGKSKPKPWLRGGGDRGSRGPPRGRRPFHPDDRCYECGGRGHYAYDCPQHRGGGRRDRPRRSSRYSRSRSRSPRRRSYSRSRSRSPVRSRNNRSYSRSRSRSRSPDRRRSYNENGRGSEDR